MPLLDQTHPLMHRSHLSSGRRHPGRLQSEPPADFNRNGWPTSIGMPGRHHRNTQVGLAPTGKRRLVTAHTLSGHSLQAAAAGRNVVRIVALETVDAPTQRPSDHFFRWIGGRDRFFFSNFGGAGAADRRMAASAARFAVSIGSDSSANRGRPKRGIWLYTEARRIEAIVSVIIHGQVGYQDSPPVPVTILFRPEPFIAPVQSTAPRSGQLCTCAIS